MPTPPRRRCFQFGLRGFLVGILLFVLPLAWTAKEWRAVQQRKKAREQFVLLVTTSNEFEASAWRQFLGDVAYVQLDVKPDISDDQLKQLRAIFPEAEVRRADDPNIRGGKKIFVRRD